MRGETDVAAEPVGQGRPDHQQQGVAEIAGEQGIGQAGVLGGLGGIEPDRQERGRRKHQPADSDQAFGAGLSRLQRIHGEKCP
jgi:hypothetical protein